MNKTFGWFLLAGLVAACGEGQNPQVEIRIGVADEVGKPLPSVRILVDGNAVGATDRAGQAILAVAEDEQRQRSVGIDCPDGTRIVGSGARSVVVRRAAMLDPVTGRPIPLACEFVCATEIKRHVLVVRTNGRDGLPVAIQGHAPIFTDADGVVQTVIAGRSGDEIRVSIDTSNHPQLRPASPSRRISLPPVGRILVFDQDFEDKPLQVKKRPRTQRKPGPRRL